MLNKIFQWAIQRMAKITPEQWAMILSWVTNAVTEATRGITGKDAQSAAKKTWVLEQMKNIGIKGSWANLALEAAVAFLKRKGIIAA